MPRGARTAGAIAPPVGPGATETPNGLRPLPRRRGLPNGRAALGGLLVALATVVLFSVAEGRGRGDLQPYVVARRPLAIGAHLTAADLTTTSVHIDGQLLRRRMFSRPNQLIGAIVVAPIAAGELVQASAVIAATAMPEQRQISIPVEAARALGERLQPGELVDVVATFGAGADAFTATVATAARVIARDGADGPLGDRKGEVVVLAVRDANEAMAIAHAVAAGEISLVRVTGVPAGDSGGAAGSYRAPRPGAGR